MHAPSNPYDAHVLITKTTPPPHPPPFELQIQSGARPDRPHEIVIALGLGLVRPKMRPCVWQCVWQSCPHPIACARIGVGRSLALAATDQRALSLSFYICIYICVYPGSIVTPRCNHVHRPTADHALSNAQRFGAEPTESMLH